MDQNGPFWPEEVHFGPFRSTNRTLAIPEATEMECNAPGVPHRVTSKFSNVPRPRTLLRTQGTFYWIKFKGQHD